MSTAVLLVKVIVAIAVVLFSNIFMAYLLRRSLALYNKLSKSLDEYDRVPVVGMGKAFLICLSHSAIALLLYFVLPYVIVMSAEMLRGDALAIATVGAKLSVIVDFLLLALLIMSLAPTSFKKAVCVSAILYGVVMILVGVALAIVVAFVPGASDAFR